MVPPAFTLNQLRIFLAVAHSQSLTRAAKLLDQTQPSLSQHIAKLEEAVGQPLFERGRSQFGLTDAGAFLCQRADIIMAEVEEAMVGLAAYAKGIRGVLSVGMLSSVARNLLPDVQSQMAETFPDVELDVHEVAPAEAIEMLYSRRLAVAVVAVGSLASSSLSFLQTDIFSDPYVLAVPRGLDLGQHYRSSDTARCGRAADLEQCSAVYLRQPASVAHCGLAPALFAGSSRSRSCPLATSWRWPWFRLAAV